MEEALTCSIKQEIDLCIRDKKQKEKRRRLREAQKISRHNVACKIINPEADYTDMALHVQQIGDKENIYQAVINRAIVLTQRFYCFHKTDKIHYKLIAPSALLLSIKLDSNYTLLREYTLKLIRRFGHNTSAYTTGDLYEFEAILIQTLWPDHLFLDDFDEIVHHLCESYTNQKKERVEEKIKQLLICTTMATRFSPFEIVTKSIDIINIDVSLKEECENANRTEYALIKDNDDCSIFTCKLCPKRCHSVKDLSEHIEEKHAKCPKCQKILMHKRYLKEHLLRHDLKDTSSNKFKCLQCEKFFKTKTTLKNHEERTHQEPKTKQKEVFQCSNCTKSFPSKSNLNRHIKSAHKRQTFECPYCSKFLCRSDVLKDHIRFVHNIRL